MIDKRSIVYTTESAALATTAICGNALLGKMATGDLPQIIAITALGFAALCVYLLVRQHRITAHGNPQNGSNHRTAIVLITFAVYAAIRAALSWNHDQNLAAGAFAVIAIVCTGTIPGFLWNRNWLLCWQSPSCTNCQLPFTTEHPRIEWTIDLPGPGSRTFKSSDVCRPYSVSMILNWVKPLRIC